MKRSGAKTSLKGQVTIPIEARKSLGLTPGGAAQFIFGADRKVSIAKAGDLSALRGNAIIIESFLLSDKIVLGHADVAQRALPRFRAGNAGFPDYLTAELNAASGATPTETTGKRAARNATFEQLSPGA